MKVAVKKSVLFNLLKKRLNENRGMGHDHGGRLIHPFNIQSPNSDPFGIYDDDLPIKSSSHMASQLSIEQPPVDDEDYIPGTINELCAAASVIAKEVPINQIEFFYRKLHIILDEAFDKEDEEMGRGFLSETINISRKTTIKDFNIIAEASKIRRNTTVTSLPAELGPEDLPGYQDAEDKDEYMRGYGFAADFETEGKSEDELEEHENYVRAQSEDFVSGYTAGTSISTGIQPIDRESLRPFFAKQPGVDEDPAMRGEGKPLYRSYQQYLTRTGIKETMGKDYEQLEPFEKAVYDAHDELQLFFKQIDAEFTNELMNPDLKKEFGAFLKPLTHEFEITPKTVLTPITVKIMFAVVNNIKDPVRRDNKINELVMIVYQRIFGILSKLVETRKHVNRMMTGFASQTGDDIITFIQKVSHAISADYANYGVSTRFKTADEIIVNALKIAWSSWILTVPMSEDSDKTFLHQKHFEKNVDLDAEEDFMAMFFEHVESLFKKSEDEFEFKHADTTVLVTPDEALRASNGKVAGAFSLAREEQKSRQPDEETTPPEPPEESLEGLTEEELYVKKLEKYAKRLAEGTPFDWIDLFPYFGFSNVPGIRQWYLQKLEPKIRIMTYKYTDPETDEVITSAMTDLFDQNMELISQTLVEPLQKLIAKLEKSAAKGTLKQRVYDEKKKKVKQVDEAKMLKTLKNQVLPMIEEINKAIASGASYDDIVEDTEFLQTIGGYMLRNIGSYPFDGFIAGFSKDWADQIKGVINPIRVKYNPDAGEDLNKDQLDSLVEYWTGLKGEPDFEDKNKAAKKLLDAKITPEAYAEIAINAKHAWQDLESQIDENQGGQMAELFTDEVDSLLDDEKAMTNAIKKAYKEMIQEIEDAARQKQAGL
jgi:hypothetical protein|tara:strand:+ start:6226 stop:8868 length:2643 start_codon:yes stop_codon:yes gene_type:complete